MPGDAQSFALIYSVEDPFGNNKNSGVGAQVMGPDDGYILQYSPRTSEFWADSSSLALGAIFEPKIRPSSSNNTGKVVSPLDFNATVAQGFQASSTWHQGSIVAREEGATGDLRSTIQSCRWEFAVDPIIGWGDVGSRQKATAGWLAALPVFEPHWQVMMAHGLATGWIEWGGERHQFESAPSYAEKNWGGGFPSKWCWVQCNTFEGCEGTSLTAVGARRGLLGLPGIEEDVGLIGFHHHGKFYELSPKDGSVSWDVDPWGRWLIQASNAQFEAVVEATCASTAGTPLRAPTASTGLAPFCRDSFAGEVRVRVWKKGFGSDYTMNESLPFIDVRSSGRSGAVEVGGGPWFSPWRVEARMAGPVKQLLNLPIDMEALADAFPLKPPGL